MLGSSFIMKFYSTFDNLPDTLGFASSFPLPLTRMGVLESQDDPADVFRVYLQRGWYIQLEITPSSQNDFDLAVCTPNSDLMYEGTTSGNTIESLSFLASTEGDYFFVIYFPLTQSNVSGAYIVSMKIQEIISLPSNPTSSSSFSNSPGGSLFDFLGFIPFKEVLLVIFLLAVLVYILRK